MFTYVMLNLHFHACIGYPLLSTHIRNAIHNCVTRAEGVFPTVSYLYIFFIAIFLYAVSPIYIAGEESKLESGMPEKFGPRRSVLAKGNIIQVLSFYRKDI